MNVWGNETVLNNTSRQYVNKSGQAKSSQVAHSSSVELGTSVEWRVALVMMSSTPEPEVCRSVKCVVVGDSDVGKTSLLSRYCRHVFPVQHVPTIFDDDYGQSRSLHNE